MHVAVLHSQKTHENNISLRDQHHKSSFGDSRVRYIGIVQHPCSRLPCSSSCSRSCQLPALIDTLYQLHHAHFKQRGELFVSADQRLVGNVVELYRTSSLRWLPRDRDSSSPSARQSSPHTSHRVNHGRHAISSPCDGFGNAHEDRIRHPERTL